MAELVPSDSSPYVLITQEAWEKRLYEINHNPNSPYHHDGLYDLPQGKVLKLTETEKTLGYRCGFCGFGSYLEPTRMIELPLEGPVPICGACAKLNVDGGDK